MKHILLPKPECFLSLLVLLATVSCISQVATPAPTVAPTGTPGPTDTPTATVTPVATATATPLPTADSLLLKNQAAMKTAKTFAMKMGTTLKYMDQTVEITMDGVVENPGKSHFLMKTQGQKTEAVTLDQDNVYTRMAGKVWIKSSVTELVPDYASQMALSNISGSSVLKGRETLDGDDTYVITSTIDMGKYLVLNPTLSQFMNPLQSTGSGKIWIGTEDFRTRKFSLELIMAYSGGKLSSTSEATVSDFDKPVQIPDPIPYYTQVGLKVGDPVFEVAFSPDSSVLAACDDDQFIYLWSTADLGAKPKIIQHPDLQIKGIIQTADYYSLAFSPDGKTLAAGTQAQVLLYCRPDSRPCSIEPSRCGQRERNRFRLGSLFTRR